MTRFIKKRNEINKMSSPKKKKIGTKKLSPEAKEIQKRILKKENEIIMGNKLFCSTHDIEWTKEHDDCLRNAMRAFFKEGIYPIVKELVLGKL
jgi:hypothetical protein